MYIDGGNKNAGTEAQHNVPGPENVKMENTEVSLFYLSRNLDTPGLWGMREDPSFLMLHSMRADALVKTSYVVSYSLTSAQAGPHAN